MTCTLFNYHHFDPTFQLHLQHSKVSIPAPSSHSTPLTFFLIPASYSHPTPLTFFLIILNRIPIDLGVEICVLILSHPNVSSLLDLMHNKNYICIISASCSINL
uniref:Uncharacterized protein n=1 Tax=Cacopsylla melanoneura TaxID=428564 RepID=A0A8D9EMP6_9HEMI